MVCSFHVLSSVPPKYFSWFPQLLLLCATPPLPLQMSEGKLWHKNDFSCCPNNMPHVPPPISIIKPRHFFTIPKPTHIPNLKVKISPCFFNINPHHTHRPLTMYAYRLPIPPDMPSSITIKLPTTRNYLSKIILIIHPSSTFQGVLLDVDVDLGVGYPYILLSPQQVWLYPYINNLYKGAPLCS